MTRSIIHVVPSIQSRAGGPPRSLIAQCKAVHNFAPDIRLTVMSTDFEVDAAWGSYLRDQIPGEVCLAPTFRSGADRLWSPQLLRALDNRLRLRPSVVVVHAMFDAMSSAAAMLCRMRRVPYVMRPLGTLSTYTFATGRTVAKRVWLQSIGRGILKHARSVHFTSPEEEADARRLQLAMQPFVAPLPTEVNSSMIRQPVAGRIVMLGRMHPIKGIEAAVDALAQVRVSVPEAHLVIAGTGPREYESQLIARADALGVRGHVSMAGWVDGVRKQELLASAALLLHASAHENFGVAVAEALAAAVPVLTRRGLAYTAALAADNAAFLFEGDSNELAHALRSALLDAAVLRTVGGRGLTFVRREFSPDVIAAKLLAGYGLT